MRDLLNQALKAFSSQYSGWIAWNLFLAFIPFVLSFWLFRRQTIGRSLTWWVVYLVFLLFLPNAPYLLTDIIHLIRSIQSGYSNLVLALAFIPLHVTAILFGFEAYVISLINQSHYLNRQGYKQYVVWAELATHVLCALGVYLGRFRRFNSWDIITAPGNIILSTIDDMTSKRPLLVMVVTFGILALSYWIAKQITLGLLLRLDYVRAGKDNK